jgi:TPR repeat protein
MKDAPFLSVAKKLLRENRFQEAIVLFEKIVSDRTQYSAEAAYCLGIIHHTGNGVPKSVQDAEKYYLMAAQSGHAVAIFRLGRIYYDHGEFQKAYNLFKSAAKTNPSGAYWAYRVLSAHGQFDNDVNAGEEYLKSAAERGHVLAQRTLATRYIVGSKGVLKIPYGLLLYAKVVYNIIRVINRGEKMKYE